MLTGTGSGLSVLMMLILLRLKSGGLRTVLDCVATRVWVELDSFWNVTFAELLMIVPLLRVSTSVVIFMVNIVPALKFPAVKVLLVPVLGVGCDETKMTCAG